MKKLTRTIHPEIRVIDEAKGLVEYIASDETLDHYNEIIRADGWRFNYFRKNAPFVDSHNYETIGQTLGRVVDFQVDGRRLIETVEWAIEAGSDSALINFGWKMTKGGFLKAVSVGFFAVRAVDKWANGGADLARAAAELGLDAQTASRVRTIYLEQEQIELSACIIGANPAALAKAYKDGVADDADLAFVARQISAPKPETETAPASSRAAADPGALQRQAEDWWRKLETQINNL